MALGSPRSLSSVTLDRGSLQRGMLPFVFLSPFIMLQYFVIITKIDGTPSPLIRGGEPTQELGGTNASNLPILGQTPLQQLLNTPHSTPLIVTESQKGYDFCQLDDMRIPYREQADLDLEPWRTEGISADFLQTSAAWYRNQSAKMGHLFHIRNNRIYVSFSSKEEEETYLVSSTTKYQNASPRSRGMLALLLLYTCLVQLPDLDGFLTFDDRAPGSMKFEGDAGAQQFAGLSTSTPPPFFTFQKRRNETGILLPWHSHAEFNLSKFLEQAKKDHPWDSKDNRMFWRGASTGGIYRNDTWRDMPRAKLVLLCMEDHMKEFFVRLLSRPSLKLRQH